MSATAQFLAIPELLEMTLLHVPTLQILVVQRVNTSFRDIIKESSPIQQQLFFKAKPRDNNTSRIEWNPFMRKLESEWETTDLRQTIWSGCGKFIMTDLRTAHPQASWMQMLVCQPPRAGFEMMRFGLVSRRGLGFLAVADAENTGEGCRMSDIYMYGWQDDLTLNDDCYIRVNR